MQDPKNSGASSGSWLKRVSSLPPEALGQLLTAIRPRWNEFLARAAEVEDEKAGADGAFPSATQTAFLLLDEKEDVLFGGAAGGGKSSAVLAGAAQYVDVPGYRAMIFRRKFTDLEQPDALIPRSHEWFGRTKAHWKGDERQWTFPSGAVIRFGYMDHLGDEERYQGAAAHYWGFDEAGQFEPRQMQYLKTRARRPASSAIPIRFRYSANPGGIAHDWLYREFIMEAATTGKVFIPSLARDNPGLDLSDYLKRMEEIRDPVLRRQLLEGDWTAIDRSNAICPEWTTELAAAQTRAPVLPPWLTAYRVMDVGSRDLTVVLFAFWHFLEARLYVVGEVVLKDPATRELGEAIQRKHRELFGAHEGIDAVFSYSDIDWRLIKDLREDHRLDFHATAKADKLAAHNAARKEVGDGRVVVSPDCPVLLATLAGATWNDKRTDYQRTDATGHADAWDALVYLCRNVKRDRNPYPAFVDPHPFAKKKTPLTGGARAIQAAFPAKFRPL